MNFYPFVNYNGIRIRSIVDFCLVHPSKLIALYFNITNYPFIDNYTI